MAACAASGLRATSSWYIAICTSAASATELFGNRIDDGLKILERLGEAPALEKSRPLWLLTARQFFLARRLRADGDGDASDCTRADAIRLRRFAAGVTSFHWILAVVTLFGVIVTNWLFGLCPPGQTISTLYWPATSCAVTGG